MRIALPVVAAVMAWSAPQSRAQLTVFDPANFQQNLLSAARALEQINNQVRLLQNQALMIARMDQNLVRLGSTLSPDLQRTLAALQGQLTAGEGIVLGLKATQSGYEQLFPKQAAAALTGLNSDLPGFVIAQVTEHVYDTVTGRHLLLPQGSRLVGKYDNIVAFGQERALVVWQRIILPDGSSIVIDNLPATDTGGYAGLADQVDLHTWKLLKGVALATVLGVGSELAFGSSDSDLIKALQQSTQSTTNRAGQRLVERNLNVQPTITVRPGWPLRVIVHKDIVFR
jgi:type IV secretion system protein VirB10